MAEIAKEKRKMKLWVKLLIIFGSIFAFIGLVFLGAIGYFRFPVSNYYDESDMAFKIPGLGDDFVPQGMHYDEDTDGFFITGYMSDGSASPVYLVNKTSGKTLREIKLANEDGTPFVCHAGGIAIFDSYVYVAGCDSQSLYVFDYNEMLQAGKDATVKCIGEFSTAISEEDGIRADFVTVEGTRLIVGEFYDEGKYPTPDSHKFTTKGGDYNQALALEYELSANASFGIVPTPKCAYSLTDKVQGMCFNDGKMYLSTSYGLSFSHIYEYEVSLFGNEGTITLMGEELTLYSVDSLSLVGDYKIPPMSEEIQFIDDEIYVMCESACNKYIFGKFTGGKWCYKTELDEMIED